LPARFEKDETRGGKKNAFRFDGMARAKTKDTGQKRNEKTTRTVDYLLSH
jgi:hypothetical protein